MEDDREQWWLFNHHLPSNPPPSPTSTQTQLQTNNSPPFLPPSYTQSLENQLSLLSLSSSGFPNLNPNLPRTVNNNNNLDFRTPSFSPFDLDRLRTYYAARTHELASIFGASSSSNHPNLNYYYGSGSGSGSGSGYGSTLLTGENYYNNNNSDYSNILPRNGFRSSFNDLELRRRVQLDYINNYDHYHSVLNSLLYNEHMNDHNNNNNNHSYSYNSNNNNNRRRMVKTRGNSNNSNYRNAAVATTPVNLVYYPNSWEEIRGKVVDYVKDKSLSQFLIRKFELGHMEGIKMVVSEIKEGVSQVLFNQTGSQFFQKLLEILDQQDIVELLKGVMANQREFVDICLDSQGTRAVQKLLSFVDANNREVKMVVLNAIRGVGVTLTKNLNGYHVIHELLKAFQQASEVVVPLLGEIADHAVDIAMDKSGCCALQNCIEHGQGPERDRIIHQIITHAVELAENDYGNYVVQYVVGMKADPHATAQIIRSLLGNFVYLTKSKFGSHVVEKCLKEADNEHFNLIIEEITDPKVFLEIVQHPLGNFVAQTALETSQMVQGDAYKRLMDRINDNYAFLHSHMHGKRVLAHAKCGKSRVFRHANC